tara:strand:+ start:407 stop:703 length:297 start_codon:yes stop_codon:yes gene_type:complete
LATLVSAQVAQAEQNPFDQAHFSLQLFVWLPHRSSHSPTARHEKSGSKMPLCCCSSFEGLPALDGKLSAESLPCDVSGSANDEGTRASIFARVLRTLA